MWFLQDKLLHLSKKAGVRFRPAIWGEKQRQKWIRAASSFIALIATLYLSNVGDFFQELNTKGLYQSSQKEKKSLSCVPVLEKTWIRKFHVVVVQSRQRNVQKSVMHVLLYLITCCCFPASRCLRRRRCLSSLLRTLRSGDATATRRSLKKWICVLLTFIL